MVRIPLSPMFSMLPSLRAYQLLFLVRSAISVCAHTTLSVRLIDHVLGVCKVSLGQKASRTRGERFSLFPCSSLHERRTKYLINLRSADGKKRHSARVASALALNAFKIHRPGIVVPGHVGDKSTTEIAGENSWFVRLIRSNDKQVIFSTESAKYRVIAQAWPGCTRISPAQRRDEPLSKGP